MSKTGAFKLDGHSFRAELRDDGEYKTARAFVFGPGDDLSTDCLEAFAKQVGAETIYTKRGDFPELDKAWDRHNREIVAAKRRALDVALVVLGVKPDGISFSRKAGCPCGCSPGFILKGVGNRELYVKRK